MKLLENKKGIVMGVANERSIAWGIAKFLQEQGAELVLSYQPGPLEDRVRKLAESIGCENVFPCDGACDDSMVKFFNKSQDVLKTFDFMVNGMAYANKEALKGEYSATTREDFKQALDISCYSFTKSVALARKHMVNRGSCLALTYYGAEKWMPHYNVMGVAKAALEASVKYLAADLGPGGVRVNAISAGPIRTLASSGIGDFRYILDWCARNAPLGKNVTQEDVAKAAAFLLSDLGEGVTGEIMHVDAGYNIVGMKRPDAEDIILK